MVSPADLLVRLRDAGDDAPSARLARLVVGDTLGRPVRQLVDPARVADGLRDVLLGTTASDDAARRVVAELESVRASVAAHRGPVGAPMPAPLHRALRELVQLPFVVRHDAVMRLLDRP